MSTSVKYWRSASWHAEQARASSPLLTPVLFFPQSAANQSSASSTPGAVPPSTLSKRAPDKRGILRFLTKVSASAHDTPADAAGPAEAVNDSVAGKGEGIGPRTRGAAVKASLRTAAVLAGSVAGIKCI